jgi:transposase-like protein
VTAGTIFHLTRAPLPTWFAAAWLMTGQKQGVSALGLQQALGLGSYQTAWAMLHRYRLAMVRPGRERLDGWVEVDEAYVGGVEGAVHGRETATKSIVAIAVEIKSPKGFGRIRLRSVPDVTQDSLIPFIEAVVEPGSTVHTDGWQAYWTVPEHGYTHERTVMRKQNDPAHVVMPGVHRVASLLQRWLLGTPTRVRSVPCTSTRTSTSSRFASTGATHGDAECCSTACSSSRSPPTRSPTAA